MPKEERVDELFEDEALESVTNKDLRWMMLLMRTQLLSEFELLKASVTRIENNGHAVTEQVKGHATAILKIEQIESECPLSSREKREQFINGMVQSSAKEVAAEAALAVVKETPATKALYGGLTRPEIINMLVGAIVLLTGAVVFLATQGKVHIP